MAKLNKYEAQARAAREANRRLRSCESKRRYETYEEAARNRGQIVYQCKFCKGFHRSGQFGKVVALARKQAEKCKL